MIDWRWYVPDPQCTDTKTGLSAFLFPDWEAPDPRSDWGADAFSPDVEAYVQGDVWGIVIAPTDSTDPIKDEVYSCWGFYGEDYAKSETHTVLADAVYEVTK